MMSDGAFVRSPANKWSGKAAALLNSGCRLGRCLLVDISSLENPLARLFGA
jgi:hypothetical protein